MSAGSLSGLRPANRMLATGIVAATSLLVRISLQGNWSRAPAILSERRALLDRLAQGSQAAEESCVLALSQAVIESERALATIYSARDAGIARSMPQ
jgi:hypothetical protein